MKPKHKHHTQPVEQLPVHQTRPEPQHRNQARHIFFTTPDRKELLKMKLDCGGNEYGYRFFASYKYIKGRLAAILTPGIMTKEESGDSFEFNACTNLTSMIWLT